MKDQEAHLRVHLPSSRVTLVLDLIVRPQMPLAVPLTTPERIVAARICRLDPPRVVRAALRCDPAALHLKVLASRFMVARCRLRIASGARVAIRHMIRGSCRRRTGAGRIDVSLSSVAIAWDRVVVGPLIRVIEVSKRVQRTIQIVIVVAAVRRRVGGDGVVIVGCAEVIGAGVVGGIVGTLCIYPRIVAACCDAHTHAHAHACADCNPTVTVAAIGDYAGGECAVLLLAGVGEEAALTVAGRVYILMARLRVGLHCSGDEVVRAVAWVMK
jgi:hypothetical protein